MFAEELVESFKSGRQRRNRDPVRHLSRNSDGNTRKNSFEQIIGDSTRADYMRTHNKSLPDSGRNNDTSASEHNLQNSRSNHDTSACEQNMWNSRGNHDLIHLDYLLNSNHTHRPSNHKAVNQVDNPTTDHSQSNSSHWDCLKEVPSSIRRTSGTSNILTSNSQLSMDLRTLYRRQGGADNCKGSGRDYVKSSTNKDSFSRVAQKNRHYKERIANLKSKVSRLEQELLQAHADKHVNSEIEATYLFRLVQDELPQKAAHSETGSDTLRRSETVMDDKDRTILELKEKIEKTENRLKLALFKDKSYSRPLKVHSESNLHESRIAPRLQTENTDSDIQRSHPRPLSTFTLPRFMCDTSCGEEQANTTSSDFVAAPHMNKYENGVVQCDKTTMAKRNNKLRSHFSPDRNTSDGSEEGNGAETKTDQPKGSAKINLSDSTRKPTTLHPGDHKQFTAFSRRFPSVNSPGSVNFDTFRESLLRCTKLVSKLRTEIERKAMRSSSNLSYNPCW